ncbi:MULTISPECIES: hypothetical protein [Clostridia]|uniref:hypothetical protein n=1 Tax=Clostridia TaxID=186801 RepID=UPI0011069932|nr:MULTISPECIES: hypothetical protein [Clostridia]MCH1936833.1 hypothetical protein [Enterocloster sp. OA11]
MFWVCYIPGIGYASDRWYQIIWNGMPGWYHFDGEGKMMTDWQEIDGKRYHFETRPGGPMGRLDAAVREPEKP